MERWLLFWLLTVALAWAGCGGGGASSPQHVETADNPELLRLYEADQAAREDLNLSAVTEENARAMRAADSARRAEVRRLLEAGAAQTATDYYRASMIFQHGGDTAAYRKAHRLARKALALDSTHHGAQFLMAASWDRYLLAKGAPQWYATQY